MMLLLAVRARKVSALGVMMKWWPSETELNWTFFCSRLVVLLTENIRNEQLSETAAT